MKKKTDRGFSLIELIIAIAILIILTGLLAPQFMKYIEKSRKAACLNNIDVMLQEYQVAMIDNPDIKPEDVLDMMVKRGMKCPSKGKYTIRRLDDEHFVVNCGVHGDGEAESTDPKVVLGKDVYERMLKFTDEYSIDEIKKMFNKAGIATNSITNDKIRQYLLKEVYGGQWPKVDKSQFGSSYPGDLYAQSYVNLKTTSLENASKENIVAYIGPNSNDASGKNWEAYFIYDPESQKWYKEPNGNLYRIMDRDWNTIKANTIDKGWIPVE